MKRVEIGSTVVLENIETGQQFIKTIKYQKEVAKPMSGTGAYYDLDYNTEVLPENIKNNVLTDVSPLGKMLLGEISGSVVRVKKNSYKIIEIK